MKDDWPRNMSRTCPNGCFPGEQRLTATCVQVNDPWQRFFGVGLVKTSEDLGVQSEYPLHLDLLDWLAVEFQDLVGAKENASVGERIVTSSAYRQSSKMNDWQRENDPENRLVSRASRFRLPSMILRDWALANSGLLVNRLGGAPVFPYQPKKVWEALHVAKNRSFEYPTSKGTTSVHRRSLYTFWRRTIGPVNMFDSSDRQALSVGQYRVGQARPARPHNLERSEPGWKRPAFSPNGSWLSATSTEPKHLQKHSVWSTLIFPSANERKILEETYREQLAIYRQGPQAASAPDGSVGQAKRNEKPESPRACIP